MSSNRPFGFDPEEFDRVVREAGEGLRDAFDGVGKFFTTSGERAGWATLSTSSPGHHGPERTGDDGRDRRRRVGDLHRRQTTEAPISSRSIRPNWTRFERTRPTPTRLARCDSCHMASRSACLTLRIRKSRFSTATKGRVLRCACVRRCGCLPRFGRTSRCCAGVPGGIDAPRQRRRLPGERVAAPRSWSVR